MEVSETRGPAAPRYVIREQIATGGMATVHLGQIAGPEGSSRTVAVKRLGPALAEDREAVTMLLDEARLAGRLHHPNVAATIDVVIEPHDACIIMEYVHGESLARLLRAEGAARPSPAVVSAIVAGTLRGLHAAHEVCDEKGEPLEIIHRDVSPQNVIVGADGIPRLIDFGIAKARRRLQSTTEGQLKGKLSYLAPEQIRGAAASRRTDIYAAGIVLWETLTGRRLFDGDCAGAITEQILVGWVDRPSKHVPDISEALDIVTLRALEPEPSRRFQTAAEMADALENAMPPAPQLEVGEWVRSAAGETLERRAELLRAVESPKPSRRFAALRPRTYGAMGAALLIGMLATGAIAFSQDPPPAAEVATPAAEPTPAARGQGESEGHAASAGANPVTSANALAGEPIHVESNPPIRSDGVPRSRPHPVKKPVALPPRSGPPNALHRESKDFCNPPYDVNQQGIRIYKRACL